MNYKEQSCWGLQLHTRYPSLNCFSPYMMEGMVKASLTTACPADPCRLHSSKNRFHYRAIQ